MDTIKVSKRDFAMKAKKLRRCGFIPASVSGGTLTEAVALQLDKHAVAQVTAELIGARMVLELDGKTLPVQLKEIEKDPLSKELLSIEFQGLKADQRVNSIIHVLLKNQNKVTANLEHLVNDIPYSAFPKDMIDTITIDVDGLPIGTTIRVCDLKEIDNDKLQIQMDPEEIVLRIRDFVEAPEETEEVSE